MNESHNYEIISKQQFGRLSQNPMVKAVNPSWRVQMIEENHSYTLVGDFEEYVELEAGANLIKEFNGGYNLIIKGKERLLNKDAYQIQVVYKDEFEFYLVQYPDDLGNLKWHLYNTSGEILNAGFDEIEIIEFNCFKVRNGNQIQWLNRSSKAIYTIGSNESN